MKEMTIRNRIKSELMNAEIDYIYTQDNFRAKYPSGIAFCYDKVNGKAASAAMSLYRSESTYQALQALVEPTKENTEELTRAIIERYNNAETDEEIQKAEKEYFSLWKIR